MPRRGSREQLLNAVALRHARLHMAVYGDRVHWSELRELFTRYTNAELEEELGRPLARGPSKRGWISTQEAALVRDIDTLRKKRGLSERSACRVLAAKTDIPAQILRKRLRDARKRMGAD